jgi:hypothetical protein
MGDLGRGRSVEVYLFEAAVMVFVFGKSLFFSFTLGGVSR